MTISERTLRKWRKEALLDVKHGYGYGTSDPARTILLQSQKIILKLTQELLDQALLKKGEKE